MSDKMLRYEISSWDEVSGCLSNSSKSLHLTYDSVIDKQLTGGVLRVQHDKYGCMFAYLVDAKGSLLCPSEDGTFFQLDTREILNELEKYGFFIKFEHKFVINNDQFQLLVTAKELGMNKIRIMYVDSNDVSTDIYKKVDVLVANLVAFKEENLPRWLSNTHVCSSSEFSRALVLGTCVNLTKCKGGLVLPNNWKFLDDKVLNISDILDASR